MASGAKHTGLTISLSSIPPRFARLGTTLASLRAQDAADRIVLTLPRRYRDFEGTIIPPDLPDGVELHWTDTDLGPATKLLPLAAQMPSDAPILICDDDWIYESGWAAGLAAKATDRTARAVSTYDSRRIGTPGPGTIVQGFAGVLLTPSMLPPRAWDMPERFRDVDDIWLSGMLVLAGTPVQTLPGLRALVQPSGNEAQALQHRTDRAALNAECADWLVKTHGIWTT